VSLRKCSDCGKDVSSSASACPHCGRPHRKSRFPAEIAAVLGLAAVWLVASAWHSGWTDDTVSDDAAPPAPPETVIARPYRPLEQGLRAFVGYNQTLHLLRVENRDTFAWTNCEVSLNSHGISGYDLDIKSINPGLTDAAFLQSAEFADSDGKRFDSSTQSVETLDLDCETPNGRLYYGGRFRPNDSRSVSVPQNVSTTPTTARVLMAARRTPPKP
jgi:hypothetical protein